MKRNDLLGVVVTLVLVTACVVAWRLTEQEQNADREAAGQYTISVFDYSQDKTSWKRPVQVIVSQGMPKTMALGNYIIITSGDGARTIITRPDMVDVERLSR